MVAVEIQYSQPSAAVARSICCFTVTAWAVTAQGAYQDVSATAQWRSSNPAVATVVRGFFFAMVDTFEPGEAQISASYAGVTGAISVVRESPLLRRPRYLEIRYRGSTPVRVPGGTQPAGDMTLSAFVVTGSISRDVTAEAEWASSNPEIAQYGSGRITALRPGTVLFTARYEDLSESTWVSIAPNAGSHKP